MIELPAGRKLSLAARCLQASLRLLPTDLSLPA